MTRPTEEVQESTAYAAIIDTSTKELIDKKSLLKLLKSHRVKTTYIENSEISMEEIIPTLKKAKVNIPETFF